ncbi:MAG: hypothetical protein IPK26_02220 [Planctomycetes bacterium]|nr:hypothetical protein [Planctomycetota bacterium]
MSLPTCRVAAATGLLAMTSATTLGAQSFTQWTGAVSSDWNNAANWDAGVPDANRGAIVVASGPRPVVAGTAVCWELQVDGGGLSIQGTLDVHGSISLRTNVVGTGRLRLVGTQPTGLVSAPGNQRVPTIEIGGGRNILLDGPEIRGDLRCTSATGNGSVRWQGRIAVTGNVDLRCQSVTATGSTTLVVDGDFTLEAGTVGAVPFDRLTLGGDWTSDDMFQATGGVVAFTGGRTHVLDAPDSRLFALEVPAGESVAANYGIVTGGGVVVAGGLQANSTAGNPFDVGGALTVGGTVQVAGTTARARGDVTISGTLTTNPSLRVDGDFLVEATGASIGARELHGNATLNASVASALDFRLGLGTFLLVGAPGVFADSVTVLGQSTGTILRMRDIGFRSVRTLPPGPELEVFRNCALRIDGGEVRIPFLGLRDAFLSGDPSATLVVGSIDLLANSGLTSPPGTMRVTGSILIRQTNTFQNTTGVIIFGAPAAGTGPTHHSIECWQQFTGLGSIVVESNAVVTVQPDGFPPGYRSVDVYGQMTSVGSLDSLDQARVFAGGFLWTFDNDIDQVYVEGRLDAPYLESSEDFIVAGGGIANVGSLWDPLEVRGNFEIRGTGQLNMPFGSRVVLTGTSTHNPTKNVIGALPELQITGGEYIATGLTVNGDLSVTGTNTVLRVASATVTGNATLGGARIQSHVQGSTLDVGGNVTFQTTALSDAPPDVITCGGNWTSNANFRARTTAPAGSLLMDGAGACTMQAAATLPGLAIGPNCVATLDSLVLRGGLTVAGSLTVTGTQHVVWGSTHVTGSLVLPTASTLVFAGNSTIGGGTIDVPASSPAPLTTCASGMWNIQSLTVAGDFGMQAACAALTIGRLDVAGLASFDGGTLTGAGPGSSMHVGNRLRMSLQSPVTAPPATITVGGDLQIDSTFVPTAGTIVLDAPSARSITGNGTTCAFHELRIARGTHAANRDLEVRGASLRIDTGAALDLAARRLDLAAAAVTTVDGTLAFAAGGMLDLDLGARLALQSSGTLRLLGTPIAPAIVQGSDCDVTLAGRIEAVNFVFRGMNAQGVRILAPATFGAFPADFRGGLFTNGSPQPGSVLLDVSRTAAATFWDLDFDANGGVTHGVACTGTGRVDLINAEGDRAGEAHEFDPNGVVFWTRDRTEVASFGARGAFLRNQIATRTVYENAEQFRIQRALLPNGPFAPVTHWAPSGNPGASYDFSDPLAAGTEAFYRLEELLPHGEWRLLATEFARVFPAASVGNTWFVGPGAFADIDAAIAVAPPGASIVVGAGTYPAFTMTRPVSIFAAGDGPVVIAADRAVLLHGLLAAGPPASLVGLRIEQGPQFTGGELLTLQQSDAIVVLTDLDLAATAPVDAMRIDRCTRIKLQGVRADRPIRSIASTAYGDHCTLDLLDVRSGSRVTTADTTVAATQVDPTSQLVARAGTSPRLIAESVWQGLDQQTLTVHADPQALWVVLIGVAMDYQDVSTLAPIDMVLLVQSPLTLSLGVGAPPTGTVLPFTAPDTPSGYGSSVGLQVTALDVMSLTGRFGSFRHVVFVP